MPDVVQNLNASFDEAEAVFNSTSRMYTLDIDIVWSEPMYPNGIITGYTVTVSETDSPADVVYGDANVAVPNVIVESVMVLPFTNYTVSVGASTSAGQGEESAVTIESPEAGRDYISVSNITCKLLHMHLF